MNPSALGFCGIIRAFGHRGLCAVRSAGTVGKRETLLLLRRVKTLER